MGSSFYRFSNALGWNAGQGAELDRETENLRLRRGNQSSPEQAVQAILPVPANSPAQVHAM
jgi:hypothetical protein